MTTSLKIKKSHELVTARYSFSLMEMRIFTLLVGMIEDKDEDFKTYQIPVKDIIRIFDIKSKSIYQEIAWMANSLLKKIVTLKIKEGDKEKELKTALVSSFKYQTNGTWMLEATFHPALKSYLLQIKNRFLLYDLKNILKISSANSIRIYELLKSFEGIGKRTFEVEELKQILDLEDKYPLYGSFKARVLNKAKDDLIKHSDIKFDFEELFEGTRSVKKILFHIKKNNDKSEVTPGKENPQDASPNEAPWKNGYGEMLDFGLSEQVIKNEIFNKYEENYIFQTLEHCKAFFKKNKIESKAWFFLKALEKGFYQQEIENGKLRDQKQETRSKDQEAEESVKQSEASLREQKLQKLREKYMTEEFIFSVLESYQKHFLYALMKKDYENAKVNKFLQAFVDKKLLEMEE